MKDNKTWNIEPKISIVLTQEDIDDIMVGSLEGGSNYWCERVEVLEEYYGEYASEQISRGGSLRFFDIETDDFWDLTLEKFLNGVKLWLESGAAFRWNAVTVENKLDCGCIDAIQADSIVQYALFGEIVFA